MARNPDHPCSKAIEMISSVSAAHFDFARYALHDAVAVITLDHPPVNGFSFELRTAIAGALERAAADAQAKAIVLIGANGVFSGGADIRQLDTPSYWAWPRTIELAHYIDGLQKPVVAAIGKLALGGGLELALGCHYRIAMQDSQMGQPEIKLGLLPGGGGTLRLPRLIGVDNAVTMMLGGATIDGPQALRWGMVDVLVSDDLEGAAIRFANELIERNAPLRRALDLPVALDHPAVYFAACRARHVRPSSGPAPLAILQCIEVAITQSLEDGVKASDAGTATLMRSAESRALRYLFFAERQAGKIDGVSDEALRQAKPGRVAVVGEMDASLASHLRAAGCVLESVPSDQVIPQGTTDFIGLRARAGTRLVEVLRTPGSSDAGLMAMTRLLRRAGKIIVLSAWGVEPIGAPLLRAFHERVRAFEAQGVSAARIERALRLWGVESGPMLNAVAGQDDSTRLTDAELTGERPDADLVNACVAAMTEEGKRMLADGRIARSSDLDVALVAGYGFAGIRGGPMFYSEL